MDQNRVARDIEALPDEAAVRALAAVVEEQGLLDAARQHDWDRAELAGMLDAADVAAYAEPGHGTASEGDLARAVLVYAASRDADLARTVDEAVDYARSPSERFDPVSLLVPVLVIVLLQTEVVVKRDTRGKWSLTIRKAAMKDAALGRVFTALLSRINGGQ
ncbi:hypothetical protein [Streptomyces sp. NPDC047123]|uniref:hypothetical protein n=1 Tax=Streptomyces sp. NPDC047123 TaxID=3155622 RepID=UPI0033F92234